MRVKARPGFTWSAETVNDHLVSWNPRAATDSVIDFVERTVAGRALHSSRGRRVDPPLGKCRSPSSSRWLCQFE